MANVKITDLAAYTDAASTDVLPVVDVTNDVTKKISIADLLKAAPLGSAAAPGIAFDGDPNTGIYSPGADQVAISTNGAGRLFVNSTGQVGVGLSPSYQLDVAGPLRFRAQGYLYDTAGTSQLIRFTEIGSRDARMDAFNGTDFNGTLRYAGANLLFETGTGAGVTERLRITSAGLVGIGTSAPAAQVDSTPADGGNAYAVRNWPIIRNTSTTLDIGGYSASQWTATRLYTNGSIAMTIDSSQRVGIGTTSPGATLHVSGSANGSTVSQIVENTNAGGYVSQSFRVGASGGSGTAGIFYAPGSQFQVGVTASDTTASLVFVNNNGTERARIDSSGRLLLGTSSAQGAYKLQVQDGEVFLRRSLSNAAINAAGIDLGFVDFGNQDGGVGAQILAEADAAWGANDYPGRLVFSTTADGASSPTERMRINNAGNIFLGTTVVNPGIGNTDIGVYVAAGGNTDKYIAISRNGGTGLFINRNSNDGAVCDFARAGTSVGTISVTASATAYNTSSDYRLKENVTPVTDGITRLQQLKPSRFNFIADPGKTVDGFIAHEVQAVVPEAITGEKDAVDDDGNPVYQGIDQSKLVPLLTAALQEAIGEIESLKARVAALESA